VGARGARADARLLRDRPAPGGSRVARPVDRDRGRAASHRAHFSWHAALHELSLGALSALHRRWDGELAPPHVSGVRALVDSASLLWRCRITGSWSGDLPLSGVLDLGGRDLLERPTT